MHHVESGYLPPEVEILFHRIDKKVIEEETEKLKAILQPKEIADKGRFISPLYLFRFGVILADFVGGKV